MDIIEASARAYQQAVNKMLVGANGKTNRRIKAQGSVDPAAAAEGVFTRRRGSSRLNERRSMIHRAGERRRPR